MTTPHPFRLPGSNLSDRAGNYLMEIELRANDDAASDHPWLLIIRHTTTGLVRRTSLTDVDVHVMADWLANPEDGLSLGDKPEALFACEPEGATPFHVKIGYGHSLSIDLAPEQATQIVVALRGEGSPVQRLIKSVVGKK